MHRILIAFLLVTGFQMNPANAAAINCPQDDSAELRTIYFNELKYSLYDVLIDSNPDSDTPPIPPPANEIIASVKANMKLCGMNEFTKADQNSFFHSLIVDYSLNQMGAANLQLPYPYITQLLQNGVYIETLLQDLEKVVVAGQDGANLLYALQNMSSDNLLAVMSSQRFADFVRQGESNTRELDDQDFSPLIEKLLKAYPDMDLSDVADLVMKSGHSGVEKRSLELETKNIKNRTLTDFEMCNITHEEYTQDNKYLNENYISNLEKLENKHPGDADAESKNHFELLKKFLADNKPLIQQYRAEHAKLTTYVRQNINCEDVIAKSDKRREGLSQEVDEQELKNKLIVPAQPMATAVNSNDFTCDRQEFQKFAVEINQSFLRDNALPVGGMQDRRGCTFTILMQRKVVKTDAASLKPKGKRANTKQSSVPNSFLTLNVRVSYKTKSGHQNVAEATVLPSTLYSTTMQLADTLMVFK